MSAEDLIQVRRKKMKDFEEAGFEAFASKVKRTHSLLEVMRDHDKLILEERDDISVVGRIRQWRTHGGSIFANIEDFSGVLQLYFKKEVLGHEKFEILSSFDLGDFIEVLGEPFVTKKGEKSLRVVDYKLVTKSLRPLPNNWHGLKDKETRYRKRYLDFLMNPEVKEKLVIRSKTLQAIRQVMVREGFLEIENPVLEVEASGANAKPFQTYIDAYSMPLFLRICAGELWQKRSLVGGFEKIFDIGRAFRNEGVDFSHNPEFTMFEYYWAYASLEDNILLHEKLFQEICEVVLDSYNLQFGKHKISLKPPFAKKTFRQAIIDQTGVDIENYPDKKSLSKLLTEYEVGWEAGASYGRMLDEFYKATTRPYLIEPIFITHYPVELKPLAKKVKDNPKYSDIFQLLIGGMEISNSYNELNDPDDQRERFLEQARIAKAGDSEAMRIDEDYVEALEYGMPPATGTGIGIDRLVLLLSNSRHLREVIAYPIMKPEKSLEEDAGSDDDFSKEKTQKDATVFVISYPEDESVELTRQKAWDILIQMVKDEGLLRHSLAVEAAVAFYAKKFKQPQERWRVAGLLHDADWESYPSKHPQVIMERLRDLKVHPEIIRAISCHGVSFGLAQESLLDKVLFACDEITGLIAAVALVRPDKSLASVKLKSIKKKFKDKAFAKGVNREEVSLGAKQLGIELDEHFDNVLKSMQAISDDLGL